MTKLLLMSVGFSLSLLFLRIILTGSFKFVFLVWNLFLAYIPLWVSSRMINYKIRRWYFLILPGLFWILFLPNAPYIITNFLHLGKNAHVPHWFDLMLILTFAWNGLLFWLISMLHFNLILDYHLQPAYKTGLHHLVILLSAIGVYLGRYGRFNSWDALTDPASVVGRMIQMFIYPAEFKGFYGMTLSLYVFLFLLFGFIRKINYVRSDHQLTHLPNHEF